jgi:hypothetical protein
MKRPDFERIINSIAYDTSSTTIIKLTNIYRVCLLYFISDSLGYKDIYLFLQEKNIKVIEYAEPLVIIKNGKLEYAPKFFKNIVF